jgi:hypothetical protein
VFDSGQSKDFSVVPKVQVGSGGHPASYPVDTEVLLVDGIAESQN